MILLSFAYKAKKRHSLPIFCRVAQNEFREALCENTLGKRESPLNLFYKIRLILMSRAKRGNISLQRKWLVSVLTRTNAPGTSAPFDRMLRFVICPKNVSDMPLPVVIPFPSSAKITPPSYLRTKRVCEDVHLTSASKNMGCQNTDVLASSKLKSSGKPLKETCQYL